MICTQDITHCVCVCSIPDSLSVFATTFRPSFLGWCICPSHAFDAIRTPSNFRQNSLCKSTECTKDQRHRHLGGWICIMRCSALAYQRDAFFSVGSGLCFCIVAVVSDRFVAFAQRSYLSFIKYCALICCCFMLSTRSTPKSLCLFHSL